MAVLDIIIVVVLIAFSGLFSGLTLGLMGLNKFGLKRKVQLGNKDAIKIYPLRKKGNLLLCTLILGNVAVNSALAVFLGSLTAGIVAAITATGLIVIFGEILPQAVFSQYALRLGAKTAWLTYFFLILFYPIAKPISMVLDKMLKGELPSIYSKRELLILLEEQSTLDKAELDVDEIELLKRGLHFSDKIVKDIMTPRVNAFFVEYNETLDKKKVAEIHENGHSRIPVYSNTVDKVVGILYVKDLITLDNEAGIKVEDIMRTNVEFVKGDNKLDDVLKLFKKRRIHLFIVLDKFKGVAGIVTLEDVLEEIVGEIVDEFDMMKDMRIVD